VVDAQPANAAMEITTARDCLNIRIAPRKGHCWPVAVRSVEVAKEFDQIDGDGALPLVVMFHECFPATVT
jgi:hypothetical protein